MLKLSSRRTDISIYRYTRLLVVILLEVYAFFLTYLQMLQSLQTDEAKYLLNIPYPHPPGARTIFGALAGVEGHEFFVRLFMATLLIQSVWFLWPCVKRIKPGSELAICALWLASGGVVLQGATVMMSVLNAWQGLVFLVLALGNRGTGELGKTKFPNSQVPCKGFLIALFWLWSLFTGYQAFLYVPLVLTIYHRSKLPLRQQVLYILAPVALLILYSFTNPLALVRMVGTVEKDVGLTIMERTMTFLDLWWNAGSGFLSILGTWGILRSRRPDIVTTFILLSAFIFISNSAYYAILLTPLLIAGVLFLRSKPLLLHSTAVPLVALVTILSIPLPSRSDAEEVGQALRDRGLEEGNLLIVGTFGHEWQYSMPMYPVRYTETLEEASYEVVICRHECPERLAKGMVQITDQPVPIFGRL